jgi:hypothetical protein
MFALVSPDQHGETDSHPAFSALFLHEDLVARTLAFEMELQLQRWRCAEVDAGRGDPGRPVYEDVFQVSDHCMIHLAHADFRYLLGVWHYGAPVALRS